MANTFIALGKTVLTGTQATITFSGIRQDLTDLYLICSMRGDGTSDFGIQPTITVNSSSSSDYSRTRMEASANAGSASSSSDGTSGVTSFAGISFPNAGSGSTTSQFGILEMYFSNYAGNKKKATLMNAIRTNAATTWWNIRAIAGTRANTAAISSIEISGAGQNFVSGSRFDLYGIKNS